MEWKEALPENVREWDEVKNSDTPEKFWEQMGNHRSMLGQSIRIPTEDAGDEQWASFHEKLKTKVPGLLPTPDPENTEAVDSIFKALGYPEKEDAYEVPTFDKSQVREDVITNLKKFAHKNKLTKAQFKGLISDVIEMSQAQFVETQTARESEKSELVREWGSTYDDKVKDVQILADKTGAPEVFKQALAKGQVAPGTMKWLHSLTSAIPSETLNLVNERGRATGFTPAEAQAKIDDIYSNPQHPFFDSKHPGHVKAMEEMIRLRTFVSPEKAKTFGGRPI